MQSLRSLTDFAARCKVLTELSLNCSAGKEKNMFQSTNPSSTASLSQEERQMLDRINAYAEQVLGDIDPQKTRISYQLDRLKPIMEEIAAEKQMPLEDVFIKYMDLASIVSAKENELWKEELNENGLEDFTR